MKFVLYMIYQKTNANDPQYEGGKTVEVYTPLFSTVDKDHADFVTSNSDGRYVYTVAEAFYAVNGG